MDDILVSRDARDRIVRLPASTWFDKILLDHAELDGQELAVEATLADPDLRTADKVHPDREVFYKRGVLPPPYEGDYLKIVVAFTLHRSGDTTGRVVTAYAVTSVSRGEKRLWMRPKFRI